jgi:hypothetical protein
MTLLGAGIDNPAPQSSTNRFASMLPSSLVRVGSSKITGVHHYIGSVEGGRSINRLGSDCYLILLPFLGTNNALRYGSVSPATAGYCARLQRHAKVTMPT